MNATAIQPPAPAKTTAPVPTPHVLLRSNLPERFRFLADFIGSPANNRIGLELLGEALRANLGLPVANVQTAWELRAGFILIDCGALPAGTVIAGSVALLERLRLAKDFCVMLLDINEEYYRPHHTGAFSGEPELITFAWLATSAAAFRQDCEGRNAALARAQAPENPAP